MTSYKCRTCGMHWNEGPTRDHEDGQDCRHCEGSNSDNLRLQVKELAEALEAAQEALDDRRAYCQELAWKYGEVWDEEDAKVRAALQKVKK